MKIRAVGTELFHADGRKDGHDEANSHFHNSLNAPKPLKQNDTKANRRNVPKHYDLNVRQPASPLTALHQ